MTTGLRVWVTRARPGADRTAGRLKALGHEPIVVPLLEVRPLSMDRPDLSGIDVLAFTSLNGVAAFAALTPDRDRPVLAVGDATAEAARAAGFTDVRSAHGDLDSLATLIRETSRERGGGLVVLHPRAVRPAGDLAAAVGDAAVLHVLAVYETVETGIAAPPADVVLIHSPRAGQALAALWADRPATDRLPVVAISAAAAAPLTVPGAPPPRVSTRPDEDALFAALTMVTGG